MVSISGTYLFIGYLLVMNSLAFIMFGVDKFRAKNNASHLKKMQRIPEGTLLISSFLGGSLGAVMGMLIFRHKTQHKKFIILLPLIFFTQIAFFYYFYLRI